MTYDLAAVMAVYNGSNGDATKALYVALEGIGPVGVIALNVFRATKSSERAKGYRRHRSDAYGRKQWSMDNLADALGKNADALGIRWGWAVDPAQAFHRFVLYVELPTGQVSFHTSLRGAGPDFTGEWDGMRGQAAGRICTWIARLFADKAVAA